MSGEDPFAPQDPLTSSGDSQTEPQPSEADVVSALAEIERATSARENSAVPSPPWSLRNVLVTVLVIWAAAGVVLYIVQRSSSKMPLRGATNRPSDPAVQSHAEALLQRAVNGDDTAADEILEHSNDWIGKTGRTATADQLITSGLNSTDMHVRAAAIQAQLAIDAVPVNSFGFELVRGTVGNPQRRVWALWSLGALGSRGIERDRIAKILGDYLLDPSPTIRAAAVDGMSLLATDEVIPLMLDRFRNDPSPLVEERAACGLAQSGMFTHQQRMTAAATLVGWTDDQFLSVQQRSWAFQALHDITGQNFGNDSAAWRNWLAPH